MFFRSSKRAAKRPTTRLSFEALDRRDNPSATVVLSGHTLNITGDNGADTVQVALVDATNQVLVHADGHDFQFASSQVRNVNINLKGGDDNLTVQLGTGNVELKAARTLRLTADTIELHAEHGGVDLRTEGDAVLRARTIRLN